MATIGSTSKTLIDWKKEQDPDGRPAAIVELLSQTNEIITDMMWLEGNLPTGNRTTVRTGLPAVAWRILNYGTQPSKATSAQVDDTCGMLDAWSQVDEKLALLNGNVAGFRLSEARAFLEAMNQEFATVLFYGNTSVDPKKFLGLAPRYSLLSAGNGTNIIDALGSDSADSTSVWFVVWGDMTVHGIYPKGTTAGLNHQDLGIETVPDAQTPPGYFRAYRDHFTWDCGLSLRDWRYVVRIANIDVSALRADSGAADLIKLMIRAMDKVPNQGMGRPVFYCNRTVYTMLKIQALAKSNSALAVVPAATQFETTFFGVPIRKVDAILNTEARVV
jgi:hypothetical protein